MKVLLVDDDVPMLKYLQKLIDWSGLGVDKLEAASSSKRALELFGGEEADLVIMDIGIPHMDGLELAAELRRRKPEVRLVFLTCHADFGYAQTALKLDADDYLIKDELTAEQLTESLRKAKGEWEASRIKVGERLYSQEMLRNREDWKRQLYAKIMKPEPGESLLMSARQLGIRWSEPEFVLAAGFIRYEQFPERYHYRDTPLLLYAIANIAEELTPEGLEVVTLTDSEAQFLCIGNYRANLRDNSAERFRGCLENLRDKVKEYLQIDVSLFWGSSFTGAGKLHESCLALGEAVQAGFYEDSVFAKVQPAAAELPLAEIREASDEEWQLLIERLRERDEAGIRLGIGRFGQRSAALRLEPRGLLRYCSTRIRILEFEGGAETDEAFHRSLLRCVRLHSALRLMERKLVQLAAQPKPMETVQSDKLKKVDRYLQQRMSENVSLMEMAEHLHLNTSYFSRSFKQETGLNFTDYVHSFKMRAACRLLRQKRLGIEEIAFALGYTERTYFSKVFKKIVGVSPKDYR